MRTLAIDLGTRRIGIAQSDEGGKFATPIEVLNVTHPDQAIEAIINLIKKEEVKRIVIGLPINMDDSIGGAAKSTIGWATRLAEKTAVEIIFVDERLSSFAAEQEMIGRKRAGEKMSRKQKKQRLDAVAAAGFLQAYLDGKLQPIDVTKVD